MGLNHFSLLNFTTLLDSVLWRLMPLHLRINPQVVTGSTEYIMYVLGDFPRYSRENMSILSQLHRYELSFFRRFTFCKSISPGNSVFYTRQGITLPLDDYSYRRRSLVLHSVGNNLATITPKLNIPALVRLHPLYILLRVSRELCF